MAGIRPGVMRCPLALNQSTSSTRFFGVAHRFGVVCFLSATVNFIRTPSFSRSYSKSLPPPSPPLPLLRQRENTKNDCNSFRTFNRFFIFHERLHSLINQFSSLFQQETHGIFSVTTTTTAAEKRSSIWAHTSHKCP